MRHRPLHTVGAAASLQSDLYCHSKTNGTDRCSVWGGKKKICRPLSGDGLAMMTRGGGVNESDRESLQSDAGGA